MFALRDGPAGNDRLRRPLAVQRRALTGLESKLQRQRYPDGKICSAVIDTDMPRACKRHRDGAALTVLNVQVGDEASTVKASGWPRRWNWCRGQSASHYAPRPSAPNRAALDSNSLLNGELSGNFPNFGLLGRNPARIPTSFQHLTRKFPVADNREFRSPEQGTFGSFQGTPGREQGGTLVVQRARPAKIASHCRSA